MNQFTLGDKYSPTRLTPVLARIVAHICADGCLLNCRRSKKGLIQHPRKDLFRDQYTTVYTNASKILSD